MRLPIGDWTINPYGPYVGCMDGAADQIRKMLDICAKYNIGVFLDIHCLKGSQNGFDNGGKSSKVIWNLETLQNFSHWPVRDAEWIGLSYNS